LGSCSPVEPLRPRRRFNIEKPVGDFADLIPQLQVVADLLKNIQGNTNVYNMFSFGCFPGVSDAGKTPKRKHITYKTQRKLKVNNTNVNYVFVSRVVY
jgi:hypothetical protein